MSNTHKITLDADEQFFYEHTGYSRRLEESASSGRVREAILLAEAEKEGRRKGWYVTWEIDDPYARVVAAELMYEAL